MRRVLLALALAAAYVAQPAAAAPAGDSLRAIHDAVFDTWFPADSLELDANVRGQAHGLCDAMWKSFSRSPEMLRALEDFGAAARGGAPAAFERRSLAERESIVLAMLRRGRPEVRRICMRLRLTYLTAIYSSPLGRKIAGLEETPPAPMVKLPALEFPPTWLQNEAALHRLVARRGKIDDVVVGSGPAGSVLAHELQRAGRRVLLIDQGPFVRPGTINTRALPRLLESGGRRASTSGSVLFNNAETVGGGSTVNIDLVFSPSHPSIAAQIESWRRSGAISTHRYDAARLGEADEWVRAQLGTRTPSETEINRNNQVLRDGALRAGLHPRRYDLNTWAPGASPTPATDKRTAVSGLLIAPLTDRSNPLALIPDARVTRVWIERGERGAVARGVEFVALPPWDAPGVIADPLGLGLVAGDTIRVEAERVILCAGTLGSAAILLRSGLTDPDIGHGLIAHPAVPVVGRFDERIDAFRGTPATIFVDDYARTRRFFLEAMSAGPEYAAIMTPGSGRTIFGIVKHYRNLAGFGAMVIDEPSPANRVVLGKSGAAEIHYELSETDRGHLGAAVEAAARLMFLAGAREVCVPSYEVSPGHSTEGCILTDSTQVRGLGRRLRFIPNATLVTSAHLQASNKMGSRPMGSVVANDHHVWGVDHLYVDDSSVFPSSVGANPMQSIYVFAKLFADELTGAAAKSPAVSPTRSGR